MQTVTWAAGRVPPALLRQLFEPGVRRVLAVMVTSLDGRATLRGRSGPLGSDADRSVLAFLRATAAAILVGAATARVEGYGPARVNDPALRSLREELGMPTDSVPIYVGTRTQAPSWAAGSIDLDDLSSRDELLSRCGVALYARGHLLVEGGPTVLSVLLRAHLIDELSLTIAPTFVGTSEHALLSDALPDPLPATPLGVLVTERELVWRLRLWEAP